MSLQLSNTDRGHPLWQRVVAHCEERIAELQNKLSGDCNQEETWKYRGRIAELKAIIEKGIDPPKIDGDMSAFPSNFGQPKT